MANQPDADHPAQPVPGFGLQCGTVAITGATGFIGKRVLARLQRDGTPAVALSRRGTGQPGVRDEVVSDYSDVANLKRALRGVDSLIHLAARAHASNGGQRDTKLFHQANVQTTQFIARAAVAAGVRRIVLVSSIGVHGNRTGDRPCAAGDSPNPVEPYAISKWEAEQALATILEGAAMEHVILRPPLVYGPGCPGNFGRLVRMVAHAPIVPLGALDAPRSFIYVENLVDALLVATRHPAVSRGTYLVADSRDITVSEIVHRLAAVLRPSEKVVRNVPPWLLGLLAQTAGRRGAYEKLAARLQVDASHFCEATEWQAPFDPAVGLEETARQFGKRSGA